MTISIDLAPLLTAVTRIDARVQAASQKALRQTTQFAFDFALLRIGRHTKEGALARSLMLRKDGSGWEIRHDLQMAPHALFVHWGTRPHVIEPRRKKALRWPTATGFAFAKRVKHPGYKGDPYLREAARLVPLDFSRRLRAALREGG